MTVVLVGADGFLGRAVAAGLLEAGRRVIAMPPVTELDLVASGPAPVLARIEAAGGPVTVVNCAGAVAGDEETLHRANVLLPAVLARACAGRARLVHLGSAAEYGPVAPGRGAHEDGECRPAGEYGRTKLAGTRAVLEGTGDGVVLRVFNPVGPGQPAATLPGRLAAAVAGPPGPVRTGPLDAVRDLVSTRDVARAVAAAVAAPAVPGARVVNVARGIAVLMRDLAGTVVTRAGGGHVLDEQRAGGGLRTGADRSVADVRRAAEVLGWAAGDDLATMVDLLLTDVRPAVGARL